MDFRISKRNLLFISVILSCGLLEAHEGHWKYPDLEKGEGEVKSKHKHGKCTKNGSNKLASSASCSDFPHWGGLCDSGQRQSPINLLTKTALNGIYKELVLENYKVSQKLSIVNNGHSVQLFDFAPNLILKGGPLVGEYVVEQVHLHWSSEHTIDNVRHPLEAHIVHRNKRYASMTEAGKHSDGLAVVGVLFHVSNKENAVIGIVVSNLEKVKAYKNIKKAARLNEKFVLHDLLPNFDKYFTYEGSLTTPSCAEVVTWIVLSNTYPVTQEQVDQFKEVEYEENKGLKNNYRLIQNTNNRPIYMGRKVGGASGISISLPGLLAALIVVKLMH